MFDIFYTDTSSKEAVGKSLAEIAAGLKFEKTEEVFPVLQITYRKMGQTKPSPEALQGISATITPIDAEAVVYLLKSGDEYYFLSLTFSPGAFVTDGKALGKYHEDMLRNIAPAMPMVSIAYGNPQYSINFNSVNVESLFTNPLNTQEEYRMDYSTQFHREDIKSFVKDFAV